MMPAITLTTAAWVTFALVAGLSMILLRGTVRVLARNADNGWDNAITYGVVTLLLAVPVAWMFKSGGFLLPALAPLLCWAVQTYALRLIYELGTLHAWLIGMAHTFFVSFVVTTLGFVAAVIAAYILYGKIISDPMFLIRLILRLIGIELPISE